jgi:hypothetical protein
MPNQTGSDDLHRELRKLRTRARLMPATGAVMSGLGVVGLAAAAGIVGFEVGTAARSLFFHDERPAIAGEAVAMIYKEAGQAVLPGQVNGVTPTPQTDQWYAARNTTGSIYAPTACNGATPPETVPGLSKIGPYQTSTACGGLMEVHFRKGVRLGAPETTLRPGATQHGTRYSWPSGSEGTNGEATTVTRERVITELNGGEYPTVVAWLDSNMGGTSQDPTGQTTTVPSCAGDLYAQCAAKLQSAGLVPVRTTVEPAQADLEKPADAVIEQHPAGGARVETATEVNVITNPGDATMPRRVPEPGTMTAEQYLAALQAAGLVGTTVVLEPAYVDTTRGPGAVVQVQPQPGTAVAPGTTVTVRVNPGEAPAAGGGLFTPPVVPPIDFSPLQLGAACNVFPFGVPCWVAELIGNFTGGGPVTPSVDLHFPMAGEGNNWHVDLALFDPIMGTVRAVVGVLACVSMLWLFYGVAFGGSVPSANRDGE